MVILRTRKKITDFLMILAWASPFKHSGLWVRPRNIPGMTPAARKLFREYKRYKGAIPPIIKLLQKKIS